MKKKIKIKILSSSFKYPNVRSFLFPFILFEKHFLENKIECCINPKNNLRIFDIIFIESNFFGKNWNLTPDNVLEEIYKLKKKCNKIVYFDLSDSTTILHPRALEIVDIYYKGQIFKNKNLYKKKFYGRRIYTDYSHKKFNIIDSKPVFSEMIDKPNNLDKIKLSWNSSISNYSLLGKYFNELYQRVPLRSLIDFPSKRNTNKNKKKDIMLRMNFFYQRNTIAWHRKIVLESIKNKVDYEKTNTLNYFRELNNSKITVSPFGWGEINYRDYEAFIYGSLLLKPNMSHIETWPNYFENYKTTIFYDWSCDNLSKTIEDILSNYKHYEEIVENAKEKYFYYLNKNYLKEKILNFLKKIIDY